MALESLPLDTPALQYAILTVDPVSRYRGELIRMKDRYRRILSAAKNDQERKIHRAAMIRATWNASFATVTGDEVYLLETGHASGLSSGADIAMLWCATKVASLEGEPVCWSVPVAVEKGKEKRIIFSREKALYPGKLFDTIILEDTKE